MSRSLYTIFGCLYDGAVEVKIKYRVIPGEAATVVCPASDPGVEFDSAELVTPVASLGPLPKHFSKEMIDTLSEMWLMDNSDSALENAMDQDAADADDEADARREDWTADD